MQSDTKYLQNHLTERLLIRPLKEEDKIIWESFFEPADYLQYITIQAHQSWSKAEKTNFWFDKQLTRYKENRFGLMALIKRDSNEFVGQCGLLLQELDGEPVLEIGYHLLPDHWRNGYATEAAQFFKSFAFNNNYSNELVSIIDVDNKASEKVALRNGMTQWKITRYWDLNVNVYRIKK